MISKARKNTNIERTNYFKLSEITDLYQKTILIKNKLIDKNVLKQNPTKIKYFFATYKKNDTCFFKRFQR